MGRSAQGQKWGGGEAGHGLSRAEAEIRSARVERGECGPVGDQVIQFSPVLRIRDPVHF
jgi:hypothetical protein